MTPAACHRVAIYLRISSDQTGERLGVTRQREDCLDLVQRRGWTDPKVYEDNDTSAAGKVVRKDFERLLEDIQAGRVQVLVAWAYDRLTRNRLDELRLIEACQEAKVLVTLVRGSDMDMSSPAGRLVADVLASVARNEIEQKAERGQRARAQRRASGRKAHGSVGWGYTKGMVIVESEAEVIREAARRVLAGESLMAIARDLTARGITGPSGGALEGGNLGQMLKRPARAGLLEHDGQIVGKADWEPILDRATYEALMAKLTDPSRRLNNGPMEKTLLSGSRCGVEGCGGRIIAGRGRPGVPLYKCSAGAHLAVTRAPRDEFVLQEVARILVWARAAENTLSVASQRLQEARTAPRELVQELETLEARLDALGADLNLSERVLAIRSSALEEAIQKVQERINEEVNAPQPVPSFVHEYFGDVDANEVEALFLAAPVDVQRRIVRETVTVTICPPGRGGRLKPISETVLISEPVGYEETKAELDLEM